MSFRICLSIIPILLLGINLSAADPISEAEQFLKLQQFSKAVATLDETVIKQAGNPDYALYLRATAHYRNKAYTDSIADCDAIDKKSDWRYKALFLKANNLVEQKKHLQLENLYRSQAERLLDARRKNELAEQLIDYATEISSTPNEGARIPTAQADNAVALLDRASGIDTDTKTTEKILFQKIQILRGKEKTSEQQTLAACTKYLEKFDPEWAGLQNANKPAKPAEQTGENVWPVRIALLETLLTVHRDSNEMRRYAKSIQKEAPNPGDIAWLIAASYVSSNHRVNQQRLIHNVSRLPVNTLQKKPLTKFLNDYPNHGRAAEAAFILAKAKSGDEAIQAYRDFLARKDWPTPVVDQSEKSDPAAKLVEWQETASFNLGAIYFDRQDYAGAIKQWQNYSTQFANGKLWNSVQKKLITAEYSSVIQTIADENETAARKQIETFAANHPLDYRLPELLYYLGEFPYQQALQSKENQQPIEAYQPLFDKAINEWANLAAKYPNSKEAHQARYKSILILSEGLNDYETAIDELNKIKNTEKGRSDAPPFNRSDYGLISKRLNLLQEKSLALSTGQIFRNDETAKVNVSVRNIESITVSQYSLDLEKFFRSHHQFDTANGIAALDIELIQPDKTWEVPIDDYSKHRLIEQEIDVEFETDKPGVAIIRVEAEGWQASTVVMRSNINLITKAAWREGLVFVSDAVTKKAEKNANVLVSNGKEIIGQGQTNDDGIFRLKGQMIRDAANLHFYVHTQQGEAIQRLNIVGMTQEITGGRTNDKYATLDAKGFIYTNKTSYRKGDRVFARGIFRDVKDGNYTVNQYSKVKVQLFNPSGNISRKWEMALNKFGSFAIQFDLPKAGQGTYVLQATLKDTDQAVSHSTKLHLTAPSNSADPVLKIDFDSPSVLKGNEIKGKFSATTAWGSPITGEQVEITYPDGRLEKLKTNQQGIIRFTQATTELQTGLHRFKARFTNDSHCATNQLIRIQPAAFNMYWENRPTKTWSGEDMEVSVKVTDAVGDPINQKLTFELFRLPKQPDHKVLKSLSNHSFTQLLKPTSITKKQVSSTIEDEGEAKFTTNVPESGDYLITVSGTDEKDNLVRLSHRIKINDGTEQIRISAKESTIQAGNLLKATVHSPTATDQALMTIAGVDVIDNQIISLKKGINEIEVPVTDQHWPKFEVNIAYLNDNKLLTSRQEFTVERKLEIELKLPDKDLLTPNQEVELELLTRDASGKPVEAEVFLNLSGNQSDHQHSLTNYLAKNMRRRSSFRFGASTPFKYIAGSRFLDPNYEGDQLPTPRKNHQQLLNDLQRFESNGNRMYSRYKIEPDKSGAIIVDNSSLQNKSDQSYWTGAITTNKKGIAKVKINLPKSTGKWKLSAIGCDTGAQFGESDQIIEISEPVIIEPMVITGLRTGDQWIPKIAVRSNSDKEQSVTLVSKARENSQTKTVKIKPNQSEFIYFDAINIETIDPIEWQVSINDRTAIISTVTPIHRQPMRSDFNSPALADKISVEAYLDVAMTTLGKQTDASALLAATSALRVYRQLKLPRPELEDLIRQLILTLEVSQKDGGWPWQGVRWTRDSWTTVVGLWGLRDAEELGFEINDSVIKSGIDYLQQVLTIVPPEEPEKSAMILFGLAREDAENFSIANRLYRQREQLSPVTLTFLAGTFSQMDREQEANELLKLLLKQTKENFVTGSDTVARISQPGDITAIALHTLAEIKSEEAKRIADWLIQNDASRFGSLSAVQGVWIAALGKQFANQPKQEVSQYPAKFIKEEREQSDLLPKIVSRTYTAAKNRPYKDQYLSSQSSSKINVAELGEVIRVKIEIKKPKKAYPSYLQIDEAIPAGCIIKPGSLKAKQAKVEEINGGFRILALPKWDSQIEYQLVALHPGQYHIPATVIRDNCRPDRFRIGQSYDLTILNDGEKTSEIYQTNVNERLELARLEFKDNNYEAALKHLNSLTTEFKGDEKVVNNEREISRMLLWIHASLPDTDPKILVERFEILSERHSDVVIPFDKILKVAQAYKAIGEMERSWLVYRAVVDSHFLNDAKVAIALKNHGDFQGYSEMQESIWFHYPDDTDVLLAQQAFAQELEEQAGKIDSIKLRKGQTKPKRDDLLKKSRDHLNRLLTLHPKVKDADINAFQLANLHFDLKDYQQVASVAETAVKMFPKSRFLSSFQYMTALGHFWQYEFPKSLKSAEPVALGRTVNANNAKYIIAQVYHAQGNPTKAIEWYEKVRSEFTDAKQSLDYLKEKAIKLPNSTTFAQGDKVILDLEYRNIKEADIQVYKVDLMRLYSRQKNLTNISNVSLAGIAPETELVVQLGKGDAYKWKNQEIELPIIDVGAYLLVCRGDSTFTSGLVLISPIELQVRESVGEGQLRFHLWDPEKKTYVADAEIKVFDDATNQVQQGRTDPRGVFHASGVTGFATVIVKHKETSYAYYRSTAPLSTQKLQLENTRPNPALAPFPQTPSNRPQLRANKPSEKELYFRALKSELKENTVEQKASFDKLLNRDKGVKASKAFKY